MKSKISPSMMCADPAALPQTLAAFSEGGIEYLHIDIMDGDFVPNFTLGTDYCRQLKKMTDIPLDIHLMINSPENKISWFPAGKGDIVSVHHESRGDIKAALKNIKKAGAKAFITFNPATPAGTVREYYGLIDGVLVMCVNPGFAGQKLIPETLEKIKIIRSYLDADGYGNIEIEVDGNVSFENAVKMKAAGADIFVAGSSSVFSKETGIKGGIERLRGCTAG